MGKIVAAPVAADGFPKAHASLLNQIQKKHIPSCVFGGLLHHPAEAQNRQLLRCGFTAGEQLLGQQRLISKGGNSGNFLQIQPKWVVFLHVRKNKAVLGVFLFLLQPLGSLPGGDSPGQRRKVQKHLLFLDDLKGFLHRLVVFLFQHGN